MLEKIMCNGPRIEQRIPTAPDPSQPLEIFRRNYFALVTIRPQLVSPKSRAAEDRSFWIFRRVDEKHQFLACCTVTFRGGSLGLQVRFVFREPHRAVKVSGAHYVFQDVC